LDDDEWAKLFNEYAYAKAVEVKSFEVAFKSALIQIINKVFEQLQQ
jgi:hypothetical protein